MGFWNRVKGMFAGVGRKDVAHFTNEKGFMEAAVVVKRKGKSRPRVVVKRKNGKKLVLFEGKYW